MTDTKEKKWLYVYKNIEKKTFDDKSTFGSGNGLIPSGRKILPEPLLTQICVAIWHQ